MVHASGLLRILGLWIEAPALCSKTAFLCKKDLQITRVFLAPLCSMLTLMKREEIIKTLRDREADLRARGVAHAALFGSVARGDDGPDSDIDIMVEIAPDAGVGLFQYVGIVHYLEDLFPMRVDVANREGLKSLVRPSAEREAIYAF